MRRYRKIPYIPYILCVPCVPCLPTGRRGSSAPHQPGRYCYIGNDQPRKTRKARKGDVAGRGGINCRIANQVSRLAFPLLRSSVVFAFLPHLRKKIKTNSGIFGKMTGFNIKGTNHEWTLMNTNSLLRLWFRHLIQSFYCANSHFPAYVSGIVEFALVAGP